MEAHNKKADTEQRKDRIEKYLKKYLSNFIFDQLSCRFTEKAGISDLMKDVLIPFQKDEASLPINGGAVELEKIAQNMTIVMGADPNFKFAEHYKAFLIKMYGASVLELLSQKGKEAAEKGEFEKACMLFRGVLCLKDDFLPCMYGYAHACRDAYLQGGDEDYVGNFKAESIEFFELITEKFPEFIPAYYFLGYAYLNLGLYVKADITWRRFTDATDNAEEKKEILERLRQLEAPVKIELGCNDILAGRYEDGIYKLEGYTESTYNTWWPLFYYLGLAHARIGEHKRAITCFKRVLLLNASHTDTMEELVMIYEAEGDEENRRKFIKKIERIHAST